MKQKQITNMTCMSAIEKLKQWSVEYMSDCAHNINIAYDKDRPLCTGTTQYNNNGIPVNVNIGIAPLTTAFPARYRSITDSDFVKMGVTTFHELTHCEMSLSNFTPKEILTSDLSKCYNEDYYYAVHHKLPHEIDAEYNGVMTMWSILENEWPDAADRLMSNMDLGADAYICDPDDYIKLPEIGACASAFRCTDGDVRIKTGTRNMEALNMGINTFYPVSVFKKQVESMCLGISVETAANRAIAHMEDHFYELCGDGLAAAVAGIPENRTDTGLEI